MLIEPTPIDPLNDDPRFVILESHTIALLLRSSVLDFLTKRLTNSNEMDKIRGKIIHQLGTILHKLG